MMNKVFIAMSLDGYISDKDNNLDWLTNFPNEDKLDLGYDNFIKSIDALVMGRNTLDFVLQFDTWPYNKPVFVLSNSLKEVPDKLKDKLFIINGEIKDVVQYINKKGYNSLYIDGGNVIQQFLQLKIVDSLIITIIPVILGGGYPLFGDLEDKVSLKLLSCASYSNGMIQTHYKVLNLTK